MYITYMRIQNYRNLQDVEMTFHERANYIVGENAIDQAAGTAISSARSVEPSDRMTEFRKNLK